MSRRLAPLALLCALSATPDAEATAMLPPLALLDWGQAAGNDCREGRGRPGPLERHTARLSGRDPGDAVQDLARQGPEGCERLVDWVLSEPADIGVAHLAHAVDIVIRNGAPGLVDRLAPLAWHDRDALAVATVQALSARGATVSAETALAIRDDVAARGLPTTPFRDAAYPSLMQAAYTPEIAMTGLLFGIHSRAELSCPQLTGLSYAPYVTRGMYTQVRENCIADGYLFQGSCPESPRGRPQARELRRVVEALEDLEDQDAALWADAATCLAKRPATADRLRELTPLAPVLRDQGLAAVFDDEDTTIYRRGRDSLELLGRLAVPLSPADLDALLDGRPGFSTSYVHGVDQAWDEHPSPALARLVLPLEPICP